MELKQRVEILEKKVEVIESKLSGASDNDRPPDPIRGARKNRQVRALIDLELFKLLKIDSERHTGGNISKLLDRILWSYYGRPKLSFEVESND